MSIIQIIASPEGFAHTRHSAGFAVLGWHEGNPVVALHGQRTALSAADGWRWQIGGSES